MALIVRIDVDRPYGKRPVFRHLLSRLSTDLYFPAVEAFGYLRELKEMLALMNSYNARGYVFFRLCTLPSKSVLNLIVEGRHEIGLHLEDSRTIRGFLHEKDVLEHRIEKPVTAVSKHGSGERRYGRRHYSPYEPEKYLGWAEEVGVELLLGNLQDPSLDPLTRGACVFYPSAFWLEPSWRDTEKFSLDWLLDAAEKSDVVMLVHPENVLEDRHLTDQFLRVIRSAESKIL